MALFSSTWSLQGGRGVGCGADGSCRQSAVHAQRLALGPRRRGQHRFCTRKAASGTQLTPLPRARVGEVVADEVEEQGDIGGAIRRRGAAAAGHAAPQRVRLDRPPRQQLGRQAVQRGAGPRVGDAPPLLLRRQQRRPGQLGAALGASAEGARVAAAMGAAASSACFQAPQKQISSRQATQRAASARAPAWEQLQRLRLQQQRLRVRRQLPWRWRRVRRWRLRQWRGRPRRAAAW